MNASSNIKTFKNKKDAMKYAQEKEKEGLIKSWTVCPKNHGENDPVLNEWNVILS